MATGASVAEQTTDGQVEEKKGINDAKISGGNVCQHKEAGGIGKSEEPKVEKPISPETAITNTKKAIEDKKDETHTAEGVKKEYEDDKVPASAVLEDKKDDALVVSDVEENEDIKVFGSEVSVNSEHDTYVVENVKEKAETGKISSYEVPEVENSKADEEEKAKDTAESLSETVENQVVEPEISSVQELEQVGQESEVSETVTGVAKATEELSDITADPALASETVEEKALAVVERASDATGELEKKDEIHEANKVLEASKDERVLTNDVEIPCEVSKEEPDVKESGNTSASQALDVNAASVKIKEANDDNCAGGREEETKNEGSGLRASESLVKELIVDPGLSKPSTVVGEAEPIDNNLVTEAAENPVKPEIKIELQKEATLETERIEEQKEENTVETDATEELRGEKTLQTVSVEEQKGENNVETKAVEEQKEEKTLETSSALIAADETGDLRNPTEEVTKTYIEEEKNSEGADMVAEEQRDLDGSDSAIKTAEIPSEKEKASEVAEEPKNESVTDNTPLAHTSRDMDPEGQKDEADTSIKEPVVKPEKTRQIHVADVEMEEPVDKPKKTQKIHMADVEKEEPVDKPEKTQKIHVADVEKKEPVEPEKTQKIHVADVEKDETENKKDGAEDTQKLVVEKDETEDKKDEAEDTQKLVESCTVGASSKTDLEGQKSETPAKPKTLMSKLKRSIVKVKKAILGKSPSSKMISAESKDASEVR